MSLYAAVVIYWIVASLAVIILSSDIDRKWRK